MILSTHGIVGSQIVQDTTLLDLYPNAAAAYSLRKLRAAYTGSAIRVRRASDNTEQDIGFDALGGLNTSSLTTFCSGTNGFVKTWYDQSGNGYNATQTTAANQPQIVSSGSVITENGKPTIQSIASNGLVTATIAFSSFTNLSFFGVQKTTYNNTAQFFYESSNNSNNVQGGILAVQENTSEYRIVTRGSSTAFYILNIINPVVNGRSLVNINLDSTKNGLDYSNMFANNSLLNESNLLNTTAQSFSNQILCLYSRAGNSLGLIGNYQEFIMYGSNQSSNRTGIQTNINSFYSIY